MAEYINRSVAIARTIKLECEAQCPGMDFVEIRRMLSNIQAADVAPVVHGRWKYYQKQGIAVCNKCSFERKLDDDFGRAVSCPNCGARMGGGDGNSKVGSKD